MKKIRNPYSQDKNSLKLEKLLYPFINNYDLSVPRRKREFDALNETAIFLIQYSHD